MIGNKKHYLIAGASGLIGKQLTSLLLDDPESGKITSLVRKASGIAHPKLSEKIIDWDAFTENDLPMNVDATFCCLGTTRAKAGSKDAFKTVDFDYVLKLAIFSQRKQIPQFHVVSAAGANPKSKVFYSRVKGKMESELQKLQKLKSIYVYHPSMLLGNRDEFRLAELIGKIFMKAFRMIIPKSYRAIYDMQVALSMLHFVKEGKRGYHVISNKRMLELT